jgi:hypothetical protein
MGIQKHRCWWASIDAALFLSTGPRSLKTENGIQCDEVSTMLKLARHAAAFIVLIPEFHCA